jgi:peptidoglycan hydrolase FlgJ
MSTFPANDLVVDVAHAADPQRLNAAMQRLSDIANTRAAAVASFDKSFDAAATTARGATQQFASIAPSTTSTKPTGSAEPIASSVATDAARKFEAFILQSFLETMLPKEGHGAYGEGTGSGVWRSMMAEQLGTKIAKAGGVGIGKMLERDLAHKAAVAANAANKTAGLS